MERLGLDFITLGGPENCCGAFHWHFGDEEFERQVANISLMAFRRLKPQEVLSLCPDCDYSFGRHMTKVHTYRHRNITNVFIEHLDELKALMTVPVKKRVVLHHHAADEARVQDAENIRRLIEAVPGIEILPSDVALGPKVHCQTVAPMPPDATAAMFEQAKAAGAEYLVVPYHSCYRQHCKMQLEYGLEVQHYLGIIAMSMGIPFEERFKELRLLDNVEAAMERLRPRIEKLGYEEEEVRGYLKQVVYL
jgi:Fe-S oxidoreductase